MNDRIRELIRLADVHILPDDSEYGHCIIGLEKFAELIVRECIQFIDDENVRLCDYQNSIPESDLNKRHDCDLVIEKCIDLAVRMKEHFGVEE
jgi:hypothetical protein